MYDKGKGVTQDYKQAVYWYQKAAEQGYAEAQNHLGNMYRKGLGVSQDNAEAVKWYRKSADQGDSLAQYNIGKMYAYGLGVAQDYAEAIKWIQKAAEQGDAQAQYGLGYMYSKGLGVSQDNAEAVKWYRKAVEQGNELAMRTLAWIFATSPDESLQDGFEAIRLAETYLKVHNDAVYVLDTLAAAYAEVGRFEDAVETQKKVLSMTKEDDPQLAEFQSHLNSYQKNKPWREN